MILNDSINLFIYSKMRDRIKRMLILEPGSDEKEMERRIREVDRKRKGITSTTPATHGAGPRTTTYAWTAGWTGVDGC